MGKDKFENEDLIKYGFPEDIWFHVKDFSSAHVYLRLKEGETYDNFSEMAK
jgi:predicted ribosome quality control (RQC) complex YloA/Tae2 family protein